MDPSAAETAYGWFDPLYVRASGDIAKVPWALPGALPYLQTWLARSTVDLTQSAVERSAVVVGCGLGDDAEAIAQAGYAVTAFDVSERAIEWAKQRFPHSDVNYVTADLFNLPKNWIGKFDLVFDFRTIQALPLSVRSDAIEKIAALGQSGATVLIATYLRAVDQALSENPPWPLSEQELAHFEEIGLKPIRQERFQKRESRFCDRILVQYCVP